MILNVFESLSGLHLFDQKNKIVILVNITWILNNSFYFNIF